MLIRVLACVALLAGCGRDKCTKATEYLGPLVTCDDGDGVCIAKGEEAVCLPLCNDDGGPVCAEGVWYTTTIEGGRGVCYCE